MKRIREIRFSDLLTYFLLPLVALIIQGVICTSVLRADLTVVIKCLIGIVMAIVGYYLLKRFVIGAVLMYKAFAPMSVREQCRFEPTCSTYMVMAINKYGLFVGVYKGLRRIFRCRPPNGGVDYP